MEEKENSGRPAVCTGCGSGVQRFSELWHLVEAGCSVCLPGTVVRTLRQTGLCGGYLGEAGD